MRITSATSLSDRTQQGAFSVMAAVVLFTLLLCMLLVVDSGRLFLEKRQLQKAADTAALEASVQGACFGVNHETDATALEQAQGNAHALVAAHISERSGVTPDALSVSCTDIVTSDQGGTPVRVLGGNAGGAVHVLLSKQVRGSLLTCLSGECDVDLQASAVAGRGGDPLAVFSVGSKLAHLGPSSSALGPLLRGIGLNLDDTSLVGYNGLADVKITPGGLLEALGLPIPADLTVGSVNALIEGEGIRVGQVLDAAVTAAGRSDLLGANLALLNAVKARLKVEDLTASIPLFRDEAGNAGIFALVSTGPTAIESALGVDVGVLDVISGAIGIATQNRAIEVDLDILGGIGGGLQGLLGLSVDVNVGLVEPPSIGIGGIGARAYTAQLRTYLNVESHPQGLGALLNLLNIDIHLPIILDVVTAQGEITDLCSTRLYDSDKKLDRAEIAVDGTVAQLCLGAPQDLNTLFSTTNACAVPDLYKPNTTFINVLGLIQLKNRLISLDVLPLEGEVVLAKPEPDNVDSVANPLALGSTVTDLLDLVADQLLSSLFNQNRHEDGKAADKLADELWRDSGERVCSGTDWSCRKQRMDSIRDSLTTAPPGLPSGLLSGLFELLGNLVGGLLTVILGDNCTTTLLGLPGGSESGCINKLKGELGKQVSLDDSGIDLGLPGQTTGALAAILGVVTALLEPILDAVGTLLAGLLNDLLGLQLGVVDVELQELSCHSEPRLLL